MKVTTEQLRQGDRLIGTVTTIEHDGAKVELRTYVHDDPRSIALVNEIAKRCTDIEHRGRGD